MTYQDWLDHRIARGRADDQAFANGSRSFVANLLPELAVQMRGNAALMLLYRRLGSDTIQRALDPMQTLPSPLRGQSTTDWMKRANTVGINVRTVGSFFNVVKYALTLPTALDTIHLLPIWEPGVVSSLYGIASWQINPEFYSREWSLLVPTLDTVEKQLKATVNLLHALGKRVGMDVIPHTDRYSEIVLANPAYFEWLQRDDLTIVDHRADLHQVAEAAIWEWLQQFGTASPQQSLPATAADFFAPDFPETNRLAALFGRPHEYGQRNSRRVALVDWLYRRGLEPVPATMAPPYRGLEVDPSPTARTVDDAGRIWRDYRITQPQEMSRVFGPLTRFKFYERLDDNREWAIDFARPRVAIWCYFVQQYATIRDAYHFDFMRGDMSHVQMRPTGVPDHPDAFYDPLRAVRDHIRTQVPYFAYFAESFLTAPDFMAYGNEVDHLEAAHADSTLGNLQSMVVGSTEFMAAFAEYVAILQQRSVAPNFTLITGDKDDPRFDAFYLAGNEVRQFIGLFLTDMPSYLSLGFTQRDPHPTPAPNEHYTKLYVFHLDAGPKATVGPYQWGKNGTLFDRLQRIRLFAETILPHIHQSTTQWLLPPDPMGERTTVAWTQAHDPRYLFVANCALDQVATEVVFTAPDGYTGTPVAHCLFSTHGHTVVPLSFAEGQWLLDTLAPGEGRCYGNQGS